MAVAEIKLLARNTFLEFVELPELPSWPTRAQSDSVLLTGLAAPSAVAAAPASPPGQCGTSSVTRHQLAHEGEPVCCAEESPRTGGGDGAGSGVPLCSASGTVAPVETQCGGCSVFPGSVTLLAPSDSGSQGRPFSCYMLSPIIMDSHTASLYLKALHPCAPVPMLYACATAPQMARDDAQQAHPIDPPSNGVHGPTCHAEPHQPHPAVAAPRPEPSNTTVMLKNIPPAYSRPSLLKLLDEEGFAGLYDFVYMPVDFETSLGFGYSFVNFTTPALAERFREHFEGFGRWCVPSCKTAEVAWSEPVQGLEAHIERYRNSPLMHESVPDLFKPLLLAGGVRIPFPPPTRIIRAPRVRRKIKLPDAKEPTLARGVHRGYS